MGTMPTEHSAVQVNGARLALDATGSGPVVLELHGLGSRRGQTRPDLSSLAGEHRLVRYDARGHGDSDGRTEPLDYTWGNLALDLLTVKAEFSPDDPVDAIGASMGAATILHAALIAPSAFGRLVLVIPPTAWQTRAGQSETYETMAALVETHGLQALLAAAQNQPRPPAAPALELEPQGNADLFPAVVRGAALSDLPAAEELTALTQPTLILPWADDPGHPLSTAQRLAEVLPNAVLHPPAATAADVDAWAGSIERFLHR